MFINGHTCKLFKNILNDVQTVGNGEINTAKYNYSKNCILILYKLKGLKSNFLSIHQRYFTILECKIDSSEISDLICLISMPAHHLSVQTAVNTSYY